MDKLSNIPTNIITGALGVGKTTLIQSLLKNKPKNEKWAILVNEFGEVGIDGAMLTGAASHAAAQDIFIKEVPGGCMCCTSGLPMQIALNLLLAQAKPDRLLIEPTETEARQELDAFAAALIKIRDQAYKTPVAIKDAPLSTPVRRLDDVRAVKQLDVVWRPAPDSAK